MVTITNLTTNIVTFSGDEGLPVVKLASRASTTLNPGDLIGNALLCSTLETFIRSGVLRVVYGTRTMTYSDPTTFADGIPFDSDGNGIGEATTASVVEHGEVASGTLTVDVSAGELHTATATGDFIVAFSNWPSSGVVGSVVLELTDGGAHTITFPAGDGVTTPLMASPGGAISLTASGLDTLNFYSYDGGLNIRAFLLADIK